MDDPAFHRRVARDRLGHEILAAEIREVLLAHHDIEKLCLKLSSSRSKSVILKLNSPLRMVLGRAMTLKPSKTVAPGIVFKRVGKHARIEVFVKAAQPIEPSDVPH